MNFIDPWGLAIQLSNNNTDILFDIMKNESGRANRIVLNSDNTISMADGFSLENASYGEKLIYDLINWDEMVYLDMGNKTTAGKSEGKNIITLTENEVVLTTLSSDGITSEKTKTTPWIRMSHELIHIWDVKNGINVNGTGKLNYVNETGNLVTVYGSMNELVAVGMPFQYKALTFKGNETYETYFSYPSAGLITENLIRHENNLPSRVTYNNINSIIAYSGNLIVHEPTVTNPYMTVFFE